MNPSTVKDRFHDALLQKAVSLHKKGKLKRASLYYNDFLHHFPDHPDALHLLGVLAYQEKNADQSIDYIERALRKDSANPFYHSNLAHAYLEVERYGDALKSYNYALKKHPEFVEAHMGLGNLFMETGRSDEAIRAYRKAVLCNPENAEAYYCLGMAMKAKGGVFHRQAIPCFQKAIQLDAGYLKGHVALGNMFLELSRWKEAVDVFIRASQKHPDCFESYLGMGHALLGKGNSDLAIDAYRKALSYNAKEVDAWQNLGILYKRKKDYPQAEACFRQLVNLRPHRIDAYLYLGSVAVEKGDLNQAIETYDRALELEPKNANVLDRKGAAYDGLGQPKKAIEHYRQALGHQPAFPHCLYRMGVSFSTIGNPQEAISCFKKALRIDPDLSCAYNGMGNAFVKLGHTKEAVQSYKHALKISSGLTEAWLNLGKLHIESGEPNEAARCIDEVLKFKYDFGLIVKKAMLMPLFYNSMEDIYRSRTDFMMKLEQLMTKVAGHEKLDDPYRQVRQLNFNLALHGLDEREIREKIARFYINSCPDLQWASPHLNVERPKRRRIRIGFLSRYFYQHTIGRLYAGLIDQISKKNFHVTVIRVQERYDHVSRAVDEAADKVVTLSGDLQAAREMIASQNLDILFYTEIGMDAFTYFLSFSRLAPIQVKRGFPVTSGIPNVDYFVSSRPFEPPNAQAHYSERLFCLNGSGYYYRRPKIENGAVDRKTFGLPEKVPIYACLQSLFKLHPEFDELLGNILRKDRKGRLLLLEGNHRKWKERWLQRFNRFNKDVADRVFFLPKLNRNEFVSAFLLADAVLDTIHFSGGNTSLECFANNVPIVTWPGKFMRSRLTYGYYRMMGVEDCIVHNSDDYVDVAIRLAHDPNWKQHVSDKIAMKSDVLFENMENVKEMEGMFKRMMEPQPLSQGSRKN